MALVALGEHDVAGPRSRNSLALTNTPRTVMPGPPTDVDSRTSGTLARTPGPTGERPVNAVGQRPKDSRMRRSRRTVSSSSASSACGTCPRAGRIGTWRREVHVRDRGRRGAGAAAEARRRTPAARAASGAGAGRAAEAAADAEACASRWVSRSSTRRVRSASIACWVATVARSSDDLAREQLDTGVGRRGGRAGRLQLTAHLGQLGGQPGAPGRGGRRRGR